jgi:hypothetical protein
VRNFHIYYNPKELPLHDASEDEFVIPLRIYGDEGPYYKKRQLMVLSVGSYFPHSGNSLLSRLLICSSPSLNSKQVQLVIGSCDFTCMEYVQSKQISFISGALPGRFVVKTTRNQIGTLDKLFEFLVDDINGLPQS